MQSMDVPYTAMTTTELEALIKEEESQLYAAWEAYRESLKLQETEGHVMLNDLEYKLTTGLAEETEETCRLAIARIDNLNAALLFVKRSNFMSQASHRPFLDFFMKWIPTVETAVNHAYAAMQEIEDKIGFAFEMEALVMRDESPMAFFSIMTQAGKHTVKVEGLSRTAPLEDGHTFVALGPKSKQADYVISKKKGIAIPTRTVKV